MASHTTADEELVLMDDGGVPGSSAGRNALNLRRGPMGCLEIEDDDVGKMGAVFVLSTKYKELLVLPETCSMTYSNISRCKGRWWR